MEGKKEILESEKNDQVEWTKEEQEVIDKDIQIVSKLESYCGSSVFTEAINSFINENSPKFTHSYDPNQGFPLDYHAIYMKYVKMIDSLLEGKSPAIGQSLLDKIIILKEKLWKVALAQISQMISIQLAWIGQLLLLNLRTLST
eukprot:TRINITY_DN937_c0_g1_i1.p1 TRINITY_DN937_c0_g1~~TRINITY_DN937_c0_g1_i1.p1  ORF type:complete len:144 (-),score=2.92 TRINITY_DN937_c0_g1_i1:152-583(-)